MVAGDDELAAVEKVKNKWSLSFPIIHDKDRLWFKQFKIKPIPRSILISENQTRLIDGHGEATAKQALASIEAWAKSKNCFKEVKD
jgi:hypothetical protein